MPERPASVPLSADWSEPDGEWVVGERDDTGALVGDVTYYRRDGSMVCICPHVAGRPHGQSRRFHESGEVSQVAQYVDGVLHGTRIFYSTDAPTTEQMHGPQLSTSVRRAEFDYVDGNIRAARYIDRDGRRVTASGQPLPDRPAGVPDTAMFHDASKEWVDGEYGADGEPVGTGRAWSRDGTPLQRAEVHGDAFVGPIVEFDATGNPMAGAHDVTAAQVGLDEPPDLTAVHDLATPVGMASAIVTGWCGDAERDAAQARAARRGVWAAAPPALRARLTALGLDRATRLFTAQRLAQVVAELGQDPSVDESALFAAAAASGPTGVALALGDSRTARASLLSRVQSNGRLALDHLGLSDAPDAVGTVPAVTVLNLSGNRLRTVPATLGNLVQLRELELNENRIERLPAQLTRLTELHSLSLSHNALTTLPAGLLDLTELTSLSLGDNDLPELPADFGRLSRLRELWLNDNPLTTLPSSMTQLTRLTFLHLGNLSWAEPPACLFDMASLEELWLAGRSLRRLPPQICRLPRLRRLHLWYSNLTELPEDIFAMTGLEELRIRDNPLPAGVIERLRAALPHCTVY